MSRARSQDVTQHDGPVLRLRKLADDYDPTDRLAAMSHMQKRQAAGEVVTGLLYINRDAGDLHDRLNTSETPLNALGEAELCPGSGRARGLQRRAELIARLLLAPGRGIHR